MVILLKIKRRDSFFNEPAFLFWCHALWKLGSSNCCIFEMKHATGTETCTQIYFLFIFNLVEIRISKTSLFWLYNLMTSLCKPSISLFFGGLIFGAAYIRRGLSTGEIWDWASLIVGSKFTVVALFYFVFKGNFPSTSSRGTYTCRGDLTEGFLHYWFGGLIFGGVYTWRGLLFGILRYSD